MKDRHKKIVLEAEEGIAFEVSNGKNGTLVIKATNIAESNVSWKLPTVQAGEYAKELSVYTDKEGNQAVVPKGWVVSGRSRENTIWGKDVSLVIYQIPKESTRNINWDSPETLDFLKKTYSQFVWVPVRFLTRNGTLDGKHFSQKFGRRNHQSNEFSDDAFSELMEQELFMQAESINRYGGFYISRYNISKSAKGKPQSVKGHMPWAEINFQDAQSIAEVFVEENKWIKSHLTYGAEYDSIVEWLIKLKDESHSEIRKKHIQCRGLYNRDISENAETGSEEARCTNNIYDLLGNVYEWTQEKYQTSYRVVRGGTSDKFKSSYPATFRYAEGANSQFKDISFRVAISIR